jgi:cytosol alanyl aminopeptidase
VVPRSYSLDLAIDPAAASFTGSVVIQMDVRKPTRVLRLHGEGLSFDAVEVRSASAAEWRPSSVHPAKNGGLELELAEPLESGAAELRARYRATLPEAPNGIYRVQDQGRWYVFTQFEPLEARRAFPCFDQPSYKTPFRVTLRVPEGHLALTNSPETSSTSSGGSRVFQFAETQPLPTYLVALAVGELELRAAPGTTSPEIRIATTQGKSAFADQTLGWTPRILRELTDYFGAPYPFQKLDQVAVPNFAAGAMENVGLVTYRESLLLIDPRAPVRDRMASQSVIAHELAHMWFGNLVTMRWWDDLWLNESFATWMAPKVIAEVSPDLEAHLWVVSDAQRAMTLDSRQAARSIREPVRERGDIYNAFDGITYAKGAALLRMLEAWVGAEPFRSGLRDYMKRHAHGSGTTSDMLASLAQASNMPVARVAQSFLDQAGTPDISFELECAKAPGQKSQLELRQSRYLPQGSRVEPGGTWSVPVCIRHGDAAGGALKRDCLLLERREQTFALDACPSVIVPNAGAQGYYRWRLPPEQVKALAGARRNQLELPELIALPGDLGALVEAEAVAPSDYLDALAAITSEASPRVLGAVLEELEKVHDTAVDQVVAEGFARWVRQLLGPHQTKIGNVARPNEAASAGWLRPALLSALAFFGRDPKLLALARQNVVAYLEDPSSVSSEELQSWLPIVAREGDAALWEKLRLRLKSAHNPTERRVLISALAQFEDEKLVLQSLGLVLDGQLRGQDFRSLVGSMRERARLVTLAWLEEHYTELLAVIGDKAAPRLPDIGQGLCTAEGRARLEGYFGSLPNPPSGLDRNLSLVLEGVERCVSRRAYLYPAMTARWARSEPPRR